MEHDTCISCSIGVIGDSGVGKSFIVRQFAGENGNVREKLSGAKSYFDVTKVIELDGKKIHLSITERPYVYSSDANIIVYDMTSSDSYFNLTQTVEHIQNLHPRATMLILGNKLDLVERRQVDFDTVKNFADQKGAKHLEISASNDVSSIEMAFHAVVEDIINRRGRGMEIKHSQKSTRYKDKFEKLLTLDSHKIQRIGPVLVVFDREFLIGKGRNSVYIGLHEDGSEVAVKRILTDKSSFENEVGILDLVNLKKSNHIVNYRAFIPDESGDFSYIILDLCEENLEEYTKKHDKEFLETHGPVIIREILTGLLALHSGEKKVLHRDLKPQNILVDVEGHMRLADFGVSRVLKKDETSVVTCPHGTEDWMAAESIPKTEDDDVRFKRKSDIQVAGMICFYVLTKGEHPFGGRYCRMQNIMNDSPVNLDMLTDPNAKRFVSWLISHEIKDRPYVDDALADCFLQVPPASGQLLTPRLVELIGSDTTTKWDRLARLLNMKEAFVDDIRCNVLYLDARSKAIKVLEKYKEDSEFDLTELVDWLNYLDIKVPDELSKASKPSEAKSSSQDIKEQITDKTPLSPREIERLASEHIVSLWQRLARLLNLSEKEVEDVLQNQLYPQPRQKAAKCLNLYNDKHEKFSRTDLAKYLEEIKLLQANKEVLDGTLRKR